MSVSFEVSGDSLRITFDGPLTFETAGSMFPEIMHRLKTGVRGISVDAHRVDAMDTAGAALLIHLEKHQSTLDLPFEIVGLAESYRKLYHLFDRAILEQTWEDEEIRWHFDAIGRRTVSLWEKVKEFTAFCGELFVALMKSISNPSRIRWKDVFITCESAGVGALPLIGMIGFLIGLILAFQSAIPMRRFGAEIFVANLIGLSMIRELGPLMTSVILAGRSGSAFAAEIGTMRINEEIDAIVTMGFDPMKFLVVPRIIASLIVAPLLTLFFQLAGLAGGAVVMLSLGFPFVTYVQQVQSAAATSDLLGALFKVTVFGVLIAAIGCYRGLETKAGASAVGASTTSAVVSGIILIAVFDGIFAVIFYFMGW